MTKRKRGEANNYQETLLFMLTLALLFAFASLIPVWEAQIHADPDPFFNLFSIIFIFSSITILQSFFKWTRATFLLGLAWLLSIALTHTAFADFKFASPVLGMVIMAFFIEEVYFRWSKVVERMTDKQDFSYPLSQSQELNDSDSEDVLSSERLSLLLDEVPIELLSDESQSLMQDEQ